MSDLLKRIEFYADPDRLFELDDFIDVADVMQRAHGRIAALEGVLNKLRWESTQVAIFHPSDLCLLREAIDSVLPPPQEIENE